MTTVILVGLIVVLLAAAYVGVLLVRRSRSAPAEPDSDRPRTVADLIKRRADASGGPAGELSGDELFVPAVPRQDGVAVAAAPDGPPVELVGASAAAPSSPQPATPAGGVEVGDAPWRRAARMAGAEPGGTWATAPVLVVAEASGPDAAAKTAPTHADPAADTDAPSEAAPTDADPSARTGADPAARTGVDPLPTPRTEHSQPVAPPSDDPAAPAAPGPEPAANPPAPAPESAEPAPVSRPLSDPDLTPLMGIPVIRPVAAEGPASGTALPDLPVAPADAPDDAPAAPAAPAHDPIPAPVPRVIGAPASDDDVVVLLPSTPTGSFPVVAPAASGSAQPVWFRVIRRDGEPVPAAVVALLDDAGREVDTTKTAPDGGGELRTPHGGRFLMIVGADGYQPRAALLTVADEPVELALLLPRSATVSGAVRAGREAVRDARVVVRQDHDVVDEVRTAGDGHYRFDDLAEGTYTVTATGGPGGAVVRLSLAEGADVHVDLDLAGPDGAR